MESIMNNHKACYVCGCHGVHKHHIFYGTANRKLSEKYGCWIWLCPVHHNMSNMGIHFDHQFDLQVKRECQERWEEKYGDRKQFIKVFGKSYL